MVLLVTKSLALEWRRPVAPDEHQAIITAIKERDGEAGLHRCEGASKSGFCDPS